MPTIVEGGPLPALSASSSATSTDAVAVTPTPKSRRAKKKAKKQVVDNVEIVQTGVAVGLGASLLEPRDRAPSGLSEGSGAEEYLTREAEDALLMQALRDGLAMREFLRDNIDTLFRSFVRENLAECLLAIKYPLTERASLHQKNLQVFLGRSSSSGSQRFLRFFLDKVFLADMS